jgi:hypothetical protein
LPGNRSFGLGSRQIDSRPKEELAPVSTRRTRHQRPKSGPLRATRTILAEDERRAADERRLKEARRPRRPSILCCLPSSTARRPSFSRHRRRGHSYSAAGQRAAERLAIAHGGFRCRCGSRTSRLCGRRRTRAECPSGSVDGATFRTARALCRDRRRGRVRRRAVKRGPLVAIALSLVGCSTDVVIVSYEDGGLDSGGPSATTTTTVGPRLSAPRAVAAS